VPVLMLTGVGLLLGLIPEPLLRLVQESAKQLADPALYIHTVLGRGAR
jgi:formate hydrogenlyase subunit 3/multisubunit Na+/H+ antiporter MnhD subunit